MRPPLRCLYGLFWLKRTSRNFEGSWEVCVKKNTPHGEEIVKPLEEWTGSDFKAIGCIYCMINGGYHGPLPLTNDEYERHIVMKHHGKPAYPGPADIEKYRLNLPDRNGNGETGKSV